MKQSTTHHANAWFILLTLEWDLDIHLPSFSLQLFVCRGTVISGVSQEYCLPSGVLLFVYFTIAMKFPCNVIRQW